MLCTKKHYHRGQGDLVYLPCCSSGVNKVSTAWKSGVAGMLRLSLYWCVLATLFFYLPAKAEEQEVNGYTGSVVCQPCHEKQFQSFQSYARKSHSFASVEKMEKGLPQEKIRQCYACHTTGYGKPGGFVSPEQTPALKNTSCEVCHGPGKLHVKTQDPADIRKKVPLDVCRECHTQERVQAFRYKPILYAGSH